MMQRCVILTALMKGKFRMEPRTGILLIKPTTTGKNPLDMLNVDNRVKEREREEETQG